MRQGPNNKQRGRNNGGGNRPYNNGGGNNSGQRRSGVPSRNQNYDSSGPDVRIRGSAYQVYEKYLNLALDATSVGDRIMAESYYQHAEHYYRIINIIEYGPEDERRPSNQNNGQTGHLYQPGYEGEGEENSIEGEEETQPDQAPFDRNQNQRQGYPERDQQQQQDGNRYQNNRNQGERPGGERMGGERNQRFDNNQRRDNRRFPNEGAPGEQQLADETQQPPAGQPSQGQPRQPRDFNQRRDNRPTNPAESEGADVQMRGNHAPQHTDDMEDEGALPDFIRRGGPRSQPVTDSPAQDDQPE